MTEHISLKGPVQDSSAERVAFDLMTLIIQQEIKIDYATKYDREKCLALYKECLMTILDCQLEHQQKLSR